MFHRATKVLVAGLLLLVPVASQAALTSYAQNFETLIMADPAALTNDGWVVYGNVFTPTHTYLYGYGAFPAPNGGTAFCSIDAGQGGLGQGAQQLSVYSDYNNGDHANGNLVESNVYHEQTVALADVGNMWTFQFDGKLGNLVSPSTALAFIKTLNPAAGYATTNFLNLDMTAAPATWNTYRISITIDASLVGQLLQFGFANTTTNYIGSGVFYDNITFAKEVTGVGPDDRAGVLDLRPASPNPFQSSTRLDFSLPVRGEASLGIFDVAGRRVVTLFGGVAEAGPHVATWDGRLADGRPAPAGMYRSVLQTSSGRVSRSIVLSR